MTGAIESPVDEGSLYPDTYFYTYATARQDVIMRMQDKMQITLAEAWANRQSDLPYKTPYEALIMASIIEKEAASQTDRQLVAAVLVNRMKRGMRLQSDPTVRYGIDVEKDRPISKADLRRKTPWNTYVITGLPKTPICNPSYQSIDAALPLRSVIFYILCQMDLAGCDLQKRWTFTIKMSDYFGRLKRKTQKDQNHETGP